MTEKIDHDEALFWSQETTSKEHDGINLATQALLNIARAYISLTERVALLDGLVGDTQDFLKHLIHGDYQYRFGDLVMANGMQHAKELDQHIKQALAALGGRDA